MLYQDYLMIIDGYVNGEKTYFDCYQLWSSQLSLINFLDSIYEFSFSGYYVDYPDDVYLFKSDILYAYFAQCALKKTPIDFSVILNEMDDEIDVRIRLINEALSYYKVETPSFFNQLLIFVFSTSDLAALDKFIEHDLSFLDEIAGLLKEISCSDAVLSWLIQQSIVFNKPVLFEAILENFLQDKSFMRLGWMHSLQLIQESRWNLIETLCGFSQKDQSASVIEKLNFSLFLKYISYADEIETLKKSDLRSILMKKYAEGRTLFHIAARSGFYKNVEKLFLIAEKYLLADELLILLNAADNDRTRPWVPRSFPQSFEINRFFRVKRQACTNRTTIALRRPSFFFLSGRDSQNQSSFGGLRSRKRERSVNQLPNATI